MLSLWTLNTNPNPKKLQPFIMLSGNDGSEFLPAIPKKEITIIHTKNEATIHIEHFFDIKYLEGISLNMNEPMLRYGIRGFYNHFQTIHPKLIGRFWRYVEFQNAYAIVSDVVGNKVTFSWRPLLKSLDDWGKEANTTTTKRRTMKNIFQGFFKRKTSPRTRIKRKWYTICCLTKQIFGKMYATRVFCIN